MTNYSNGNHRNNKAARQRALLDIIRSESLGTQADLVKKLRQKGFVCTQVSVSRDIRELGLSKKAGRYAVPSEPPPPDVPALDVSQLSTNVSGFVRRITPVGDNLVVVNTMPGTAHSVGLLIDNLGWSDIAGTVAGDDTLFVAVLGGNRMVEKIVSKLMNLIRKG